MNAKQWLPVILAIISMTVALQLPHYLYRQSDSPLKIRPKPCINAKGQKGQCMFVWDCIKGEGRHLGTCVDGFLFGTCCGHNALENAVVPSATLHPPPIGGTDGDNGDAVIEHNDTSYHGNISSNTLGMPLTVVTITLNVSGTTTTTTTAAAVSLSSPSTTPNPSETLEIGSTQFTTEVSTNDTTEETMSRTTTTLPPKFPTLAAILQMITGTTGLRNHTSLNGIPTVPIDDKQQTHYKPPLSVTKLPPVIITTTQTAIPITLESVQTTTGTTTSTRATTTKTTTTTTTTLKSTPSTSRPSTTDTTRAPSTTEMDTLNNTASSDAIFDKVPSKIFGECGLPSMLPQMRIVGGKDSRLGSWPWQVSVRRSTFFGISSTHRCGGAVLNENWVATAGHCVADLLLPQVRIRMGEYDLSSISEPYAFIERGILQRTVHPNYNADTYEHDLALVRLDKPLLSEPNIAPICLPSNDDLLIGDAATITGWGRLKEGGTLPSILQEVQVPIVSNSKCEQMFLAAGRRESIPDFFICAGFENGGKDSCQGDSGGPLQIKSSGGNWFLAGIISWGIGCGEPNLPGVCTRISKFKAWILETIEKEGG